MLKFLDSKEDSRNSLAVQGLGLRALTAEGPGSTPGQGTKIPQASGHGQKKQKNKKKRRFIVLSYAHLPT